MAARRRTETGATTEGSAAGAAAPKPPPRARTSSGKKGETPPATISADVTLNESSASDATPNEPTTPRVQVSPEERYTMIAEAAYLRAQKRGFAPGGEVEDWLAAEREVDSLLSAEHAPRPQ